MERWAKAPYTILITGETGTGKTLLAAHIHRMSGRQGPFVERSMTHVPDGLAESEFLGYREGSYTGAHRSHAGLFEQAFRGTLFLDELHLASPKTGRERPPMLGAAARRLFLKAPWPGNIRELRSVCEYLVTEAGEEAGPQDLPPAFLATLAVEPSRPDEPLAVRTARMVRECRGNKADAARRLRISRGHLYRVLETARSSGGNPDVPRARE